MTSAGKTMDEDSTVSQMDMRSGGIIDADIPAWIIPLLNKYKTEISAEVTARVEYSVRLMLDKQLDEMKAAIFQQTKKFEEAAKAAVLEELESEKERKRQMKEQNKGKSMHKREDAIVMNQSCDTAAESLKDAATQPVIPSQVEILNEEQELDMVKTEANAVKTEANVTEIEANDLIPQLQLQSPGLATHPDTLQLVHTTKDGLSVENNILPSFVGREERSSNTTEIKQSNPDLQRQLQSPGHTAARDHLTSSSKPNEASLTKKSSINTVPKLDLNLSTPVLPSNEQTTVRMTVTKAGPGSGTHRRGHVHDYCCDSDCEGETEYWDNCECYGCYYGFGCEDPDRPSAGTVTFRTKNTPTTDTVRYRKDSGLSGKDIDWDLLFSKE